MFRVLFLILSRSLSHPLPRSMDTEYACNGNKNEFYCFTAAKIVPPQPIRRPAM